MFIVITIHTFKDKSMYGRATLVKQRPCFLTRRFLLHRCFFIFHFVSFLFFARIHAHRCIRTYTFHQFYPYRLYMRHIVWRVAEKRRDEKEVVYFLSVSYCLFMLCSYPATKIVRMKMNKKKYKKNIVCTSINGIFIQE